MAPSRARATRPRSGLRGQPRRQLAQAACAVRPRVQTDQTNDNAILKVSLDRRQGLRFLSLLEPCCRYAAQRVASRNHPEVHGSPSHDPFTIQYAAVR